MVKNILFVCSANKDRSKTAEDYFSAQYKDYNFLSAGTNYKICMQLGTTLLEDFLLDWATAIFVMEKKHAAFIKQMDTNNYSAKVTVLGIKDVYKYFDKTLITILDEKMKPYLDCE